MPGSLVAKGILCSRTKQGKMRLDCEEDDLLPNKHVANTRATYLDMGVQREYSNSDLPTGQFYAPIWSSPSPYLLSCLVIPGTL